MPIYSYKCESCRVHQTAFRTIAGRGIAPICACGGVVTKILDAPAVRGDLPGYDCPISGKWIEGRKAHAENLKQHGCRVLESGENQLARKRLDSENDALDERIAETAADFTSRLPSEDRVALEQALTGGLDIGFNRETGEKVGSKNSLGFKAQKTVKAATLAAAAAQP